MRGTLIGYIVTLLSSGLYAQDKSCLSSEVATLNSEGKVYNLVTFEYDKSKNLIHKKTVVDFGGTPSVSTVSNSYNLLNQLVKTESTFNQRLTNALEFTYDLLGNKLSERQLTDGILSSTNSFSGGLDEITNFDDDGSVSTKVKTVKSKTEEVKTILNRNDEMISQEITTFSEQGLKMKYELIEPKAFLNKSIKYRYNESGKLVEENHMYNEKISLQMLHEYDGENVMVYKGLLPNGKEQFRVEYSYTNGLQTQVKNYTDGVLYTTIEKKYDSRRNLLQEITSNNKGQILTSTNYKYECD